MIKTGSIYGPKNSNDGHRILITRYYPRGVKKTHFTRWMRELAPSKELLRSYKDDKISWEQFKDIFSNQMNSSPESIKTIDSLATLAVKENITLLCYERDSNPCHRYLVQDMVRDRMEQSD